MNAGAHDGSANVVRRFAKFVDQPNRAIVKSAGNEGGAARHAQFAIVDKREKVLRWDSRLKPRPARPGGSDELELWFGTHNVYEFRLQDPDLQFSSPLVANASTSEKLSTRNNLDAVYEQYATTNQRRSRLFVVISRGEKEDVQPGEWLLSIRATDFRAPDRFNAWLEDKQDRAVSFKADAKDECTITVPGTGREVITVGAITPDNDGRIYQFGSHGPNADGVMKPDLVAPGVGIAAALAGTDKDAMVEATSGTSLAAPFVTGAIALALSMAAKSATAERPAVTMTQTQLRQLLVDKAKDFNLDGDPERGHGCLDVVVFLDEVRRQLTR
jgi:subtilisin family serine protease